MSNTLTYTFVEVILPINRSEAFTYAVPQHLLNAIVIGQLIEVSYGNKKIYTGVVIEIHQEKPSYKVKEVYSLISKEPAVYEKNIAFWKWLADYYLCPLGDIMKTALPKGMLISSESIIRLHASFQSYHQIYEIAHLSNRKIIEKSEMLIKALISKEKISLSEVSILLAMKNVYPVVNFLIEQNIVELEEEIKENYQIKTEDLIVLDEKYQGEELKRLFEELSRAPKQLELVLAYLSLNKLAPKQAIKKSNLLEKANTSHSVLNGLLKKDVFRIQQREISRLQERQKVETPIETELNEYQTVALQSLQEEFIEKDIVLLHGITSSGKTHVYIELIKEYLEKEGQVLFLLPEIALTTQIIKRLEHYFGDKIGVYHSKFNHNERVEIWNKVKTEDYKIVVGPRSALFLPFQNLSLIIVDEEHDLSYKQFDPAPRYNGRDCAVFLAHLFKAKVVLGTATPAIDSYYNAEIQKYGKVELMERHLGGETPEIVLVDLKAEIEKGKARPILSKYLKEQMALALADKKQIILFQNRRGYVPILECNDCGWSPMCDNCDITLTYYKSKNELNCHYCGVESKQPIVCVSCGSTDIDVRGFGTEKVEEELMIYFPENKVARMDLDSTRTKHGHENIIQSFESGAVDILVGTQMVSKGLDFQNVAIVGVLSGDSILYHTDYRSNEKAFNLLTQISGRAGRSHDRGKVIIQSLDIDNEILRMVLRSDFNTYVDFEMNQRKVFKYPPFVRMVRILVKHENYIEVEKVANELVKVLKLHFGARVLGPEYPPVARIRNRYINQIIVKLSKDKTLHTNKQQIKLVIDDFYKNSRNTKARVSIDVDPIN